ncbi:MAG: homoserine kinase [Bacteroidia bacterium]|nr:homoserine kinase [Bacteroidia bacterium]
MKSSAFAPATVSNLACGFDILGFAMESPGDVVTAEKRKEKGVGIKKIISLQGTIPLVASKNTAGVAALLLLKKINARFGVDLFIEKNLPIGSGLGSSAASAVAAAMAVNKIAGEPFSKIELVAFAKEAERVACGSAHADNVAPSMLGGLVLIRSTELPDIISLPVPDKLFYVVVHPHVEVLTSASRAILPQNVSLRTMVYQSANLGAFVSSLYTNDYKLMSRTLEDVIAEPVRKKLIPAFDEVKKAAMKNGALGCSISGSGPSVFALFDKKNLLERASVAMKKEFTRKNIFCDVFSGKISKRGARLV